MASMPIEPTVPASAATVPSQDTASFGSTQPAASEEYKSIVRDRNDEFGDLAPNETDAMGIKPVAGLPGSQGVQLAEPQVAEREARAGGSSDAGPASHARERQGGITHTSKVPGVDAEVAEGEGAPSFKDKVKGFAKVHRGHLFGTGEKEEGQQILSGEKQL